MGTYGKKKLARKMQFCRKNVSNPKIAQFKTKKVWTLGQVRKAPKKKKTDERKSKK